ncbi:MAG: plasmid stabilization protein [Desulfovibrionales bacterium]|nr:MAG: plasmid stabilization protein [Desulfovibrionales bacterium]
MTCLTLHHVDEPVMAHLKNLAEANSRSIEEEASELLRMAVLFRPGQKGLGTRISQRFSEAGGFDLPEIPRSLPRPAPDFSRNEQQ